MAERSLLDVLRNRRPVTVAPNATVIGRPLSGLTSSQLAGALEVERDLDAPFAARDL